MVNSGLIISSMLSVNTTIFNVTLSKESKIINLTQIKSIARKQSLNHNANNPLKKASQTGFHFTIEMRVRRVIGLLSTGLTTLSSFSNFWDMLGDFSKHKDNFVQSIFPHKTKQHGGTHKYYKMASSLFLISTPCWRKRRFD